MIKKLKDLYPRLDLVNTLFLSLTPIIAVIGSGYVLWRGHVPYQTWLLTLFMIVMTGIAVTAGYHRLFSHRAYEANWLFKAAMLIFGAAAFENSARRWASDHRNHHKFVDTDQDPYNIKRGFFYAHMGWVCLKYEHTHAYDNVPDLDADKLVRFQERHYVKIGILVGFIMPALLGLLWGDPVGAFFLAGCLRVVLNHHFTFSINSFAHLFGSQPYSDQNTARDSWFLALVTYGEGYHNFHHKFPSDYRNGIRHYHWDPTKWAIKALSWMGVTHSLRQISNERILLAKIRMDEKRMVRKLAAAPARHSVSHELVASARVKFEEAVVRFQSLKRQYAEAKQERLVTLNAQMNARIETLKADLLRAQHAFHEAKDSWKQLCQNFGIRPSTVSI